MLRFSTSLDKLYTFLRQPAYGRLSASHYRRHLRLTGMETSEREIVLGNHSLSTSGKACSPVIALSSFLRLGWKSAWFHSPLIKTLEICIFLSIITFVCLLEGGYRSVFERWTMSDSCFSKCVRNNLYVLLKVVKCEKVGSL